MSGFVVAIDGPAASGKSTTARLAAERLGFLYLDTGAMYRALTWKALERGIDVEDQAALAELAETTRLELAAGADGVHVLLDSEDVSERIRDPRVSRSVSAVARCGAVRDAMVRRQREIGSRGSVVVEGRDIGTVVFPDAPVKIFLVASLGERAERRRRELSRQGVEQSREDLVEEIRVRDEVDSAREVSPLRQADDAVLLDTTGLTVEDQVEEVVRVVREVMARS